MMEREQIAAYLIQAAQDTDAALQSLLPLRQVAPESELFFAMRYSVFAGGKRLRPALFIAVLEAFGQNRRPFLPFAAALELIHTYSLIHDDLPAMDNADLRRGQPSCHKAFSEALAILAGDGLLSQAFVMMSEPIADIDPARQLRALRLTAHLAGLGGMVAGQAAELAAAQQPPERSLLDYIYDGKTGALFAAAVQSAAILAGAEETDITALGRYAQYLGRAFQIIDDILDIGGDQVELGKAVGSDAKNQLTTYASLFGCLQARQYAMEAAEEAKEALDSLSVKADLLQGLIPLLTERRK